MPSRPPHPCSVPGCPALVPVGIGRCEQHTEQMLKDSRRTSNAARRARETNPYKGKRWAGIRAALLQRDPICVICRYRPSQVADHWPDSRRDLVASGVPDPDALHRLRGLCRSCDAKQTAARAPGGWNIRVGA